MISGLYQDASLLLNTTSQQFSKLSEKIVSESVKRLQHHKYIYGVPQGSVLGPPDPARKRFSPNSLYNSLTRLEGLAIKQGIIPELNQADLETEVLLGSGAYGDVHKGLLRVSGKKANVHRVAIKTLKSSRGVNVAAFLRELHILRICGTHPNVVRFYGAVTNHPCPKVVLELCSRGDLISLASSCTPCLEEKAVYGRLKDNTILTFQRVFEILRKIANGLGYLHGKGIVHRDLAARNILLDRNFQPKISDFGLSSYHKECTGEHYLSQGVAIPVRWAAPELVLKKLYSSKSDVWSFGILISEVISYGDVPWPKQTEADIRRAMRGKRSPEPPHNTYYKLQRVLLQCWEYDVERRPSLKHLAISIGNIDVLS